VARAVYSVGFVEYTHDTPNASYDVPDGFTAVIRQISGTQEVGTYDLAVIIQNSEAAPGLTIWQQTGIGALTYVAAEGRWVVPGGGIITIDASAVGSTPSFYVGGYLLRND